MTGYRIGDTIAAVSTAHGEAAIAVLRVSGPAARDIARRLATSARTGSPLSLAANRSHRLHHVRLADPATGEAIDDALVSWMAGPNTYTGEDTIELSVHGGSVTVRETLRVILESGARPAEPGEFTLRAFLNGRMDLAQAESVVEIIHAQTAETMRQAVASLEGDLSRRIAPAREAVLNLIAYLDAAADFPEDEIPSVDIDRDLTTALDTLDDLLAGAEAGMLLRDGARVAIVGRPNVGKSSLLNALLRADRAIVTPIAGTTRDVITETADLQGIPVTLFDTAGIADTADVVEQLGIARGRTAAERAAAVILVLDGSTPPTDDDRAVAQWLADGPEALVLVAINKADLSQRPSQADILALLPSAPAIGISTRTGGGLPALEDALVALLRVGTVPARPSLVSARQRAALGRAREHVAYARDGRDLTVPLDLLATDIRAAFRAIGEITGESVDEAILAEIFTRFCIGK